MSTKTLHPFHRNLRGLRVRLKNGHILTLDNYARSPMMGGEVLYEDLCSDFYFFDRADVHCVYAHRVLQRDLRGARVKLKSKRIVTIHPCAGREFRNTNVSYFHPTFGFVYDCLPTDTHSTDFDIIRVIKYREV